MELYRGADKSLARPGRKQARKHVRHARDFNKIETRAAIKLFFLQGKARKEIHAILTETLACFLPGRAKDLSAPLVPLLPLNAFISRTRTISLSYVEINIINYLGCELSLDGETDFDKE